MSYQWAVNEKVINEKPEYDLLINTGLYVLNPDVLKLIKPKKVYHITNLIDDAKKNVFFFSLLTLLVELFPIKSTGSIFSTLNATFIFLMIALMLGTSKILKKTFKL